MVCDGCPPRRISTRFDYWVEERCDDDWTQLEVRDGAKVPLIVEALKRQVETGKRCRPMAVEEVLVAIRYKDRDSKVVKTDYYLSNAAAETPLEAEHRIEECFQRAKGQVRLADYEVRNWTGWHHHQTLCLLASWFLLVETRRAEKKSPAMTFQQVRIEVASRLRNELGCDSARHVNWRIELRLLRNQRARLYHWEKHNRLPPKNLERKRILGQSN